MVRAMQQLVTVSSQLHFTPTRGFSYLLRFIKIYPPISWSFHYSDYTMHFHPTDHQGLRETDNGFYVTSHMRVAFIEALQVVRYVYFTEIMTQYGVNGNLFVQNEARNNLWLRLRTPVAAWPLANTNKQSCRQTHSIHLFAEINSVNVRTENNIRIQLTNRIIGQSRERQTEKSTSTHIACDRHDDRRRRNRQKQANI